MFRMISHLMQVLTVKVLRKALETDVTVWLGAMEN